MTVENGAISAGEMQALSLKNRSVIVNLYSYVTNRRLHPVSLFPLTLASCFLYCHSLPIASSSLYCHSLPIASSSLYCHSLPIASSSLYCLLLPIASSSLYCHSVSGEPAASRTADTQVVDTGEERTSGQPDTRAMRGRPTDLGGAEGPSLEPITRGGRFTAAITRLLMTVTMVTLP